MIGLGTASSAFTSSRYERAVELLECFLAAGGNIIDTAHIYGFGDSEKTLGRWLNASAMREKLVIVTKGCHPVVDTENVFSKPWLPRVTPAAIRDDLSESLERLQTDYIDLYLLHRDDESVPVGPLVEALNQEQSKGRIRSFGVSNWRVDRINEANHFALQHGLNGIAISSPNLSLAIPNKMQFPGTLFADEPTRQWHQKNQFPLLAWSALASGFMGGKYSPKNPVDQTMKEIYYSDANFERLSRAKILAARHNVPVAQIGLAYVLGQLFPVIALVGPTSVLNLKETFGALSFEINRNEIDYLDMKEG
jgi:aryl-alcohol dehydrogenase-like predicted oxidoreductase